MRRENAGVCLVVIASAACSEASRLFGYERIRGYGPVKAAADAKARYAQLAAPCQPATGAAADRRGVIASSVGPVAWSCCAVRGQACFCSVNSMMSADDQCT